SARQCNAVREPAGVEGSAHGLEQTDYRTAVSCTGGSFDRCLRVFRSQLLLRADRSGDHDRDGGIRRSVLRGRAARTCIWRAVSPGKEPADRPANPDEFSEPARKGGGMIIYPSIDIRGGQVVRLKEGRADQQTVFGSDPVAAAQRWIDE